MIHDQMCYRSHDNPLGPDPFCQCDLIAKVREDTIAAAVQRVEALPIPLDEDRSLVMDRIAVINAIT
jgi:hypothetical protein